MLGSLGYTLHFSRWKDAVKVFIEWRSVEKKSVDHVTFSV
jgi:hypothetical protein